MSVFQEGRHNTHPYTGQFYEEGHMPRRRTSDTHTMSFLGAEENGMSTLERGRNGSVPVESTSLSVLAANHRFYQHILGCIS